MKLTFAALTCVVSLFMATNAKAGAVWDAAADFSATNNPNGVWSYGWSAALGGTFNLDTDHQIDSGLDQWRSDLSPTGDGNPSIHYNGTASPITLHFSATVQPGQLIFHPGFSGENAVVRFTAPFENAQDRLWPVGSLKPNDLGLFDMLGNAYEWCHDRFFGFPPSSTPGEDVIGKADTDRRVLRGGAFLYPPVFVRSAYRSLNQPADRIYNAGFRPARTYP